jgi:isoleucyl-tRNA synthetase
LVHLSQILAPFTPFLAEELYQKLVGGESVHLLDWPEVGHVDELLIRDMEDIRGGIQQGLALRAAAGIKVRQPLSTASVSIHALPDTDERANFYKQIVEEELNVKLANITEIKSSDDSERTPETTIDLHLTTELKQEGLMREVIRHVQQARKQAGLEVDDRIHLDFHTEGKHLDKLLNSNDDLTTTLLKEVLALPEEETGKSKDYTTTVTIEGEDLTIGISKAH